MPLRNSTREVRKWSRVASDQQRSKNGTTVSQTMQPGARPGPAVWVFSSISDLPHFHGQNSILQLCAAGGKAGHRGGQADMPAQRADFDHQLVALLKQAHLTLHRKRQFYLDLVVAVMFDEGEWRLRARNRRGVLLFLVQRPGQIVQPLAAQHFVRE